MRPAGPVEGTGRTRRSRSLWGARAATDSAAARSPSAPFSERIAGVPRSFSGSPAFPEGLTVREGRGQWREQDGDIVREASYEAVLLYPEKEAGERSARIERIRQAYEDRYQQDSVGRSDDKVTAEF